MGQPGRQPRPLPADPHHNQQRGLLTPSFTPRLIESLRGHVGENARELARELAAVGGRDFVAMISIELTTRVLANLLGTPQGERERVLARSKISDVQMPSSTAILRTSSRLSNDLFGHARVVRNDRRANPREDLMSWLANAAVWLP